MTTDTCGSKDELAIHKDSRRPVSFGEVERRVAAVPGVYDALSRGHASEAGEKALELFIVADDAPALLPKEFGVHCRTSGPVSQ